MNVALQALPNTGLGSLGRKEKHVFNGLSRSCRCPHGPGSSSLLSVHALFSCDTSEGLGHSRITLADEWSWLTLHSASLGSES